MRFEIEPKFNSEPVFICVLVVFFVRSNVNNTPPVSAFQLRDVAPVLARQFKSPMFLVLGPSKTMEIEASEGLSSNFVNEFSQSVLYISVNFVLAKQFLNALVNLNVLKRDHLWARRTGVHVIDNENRNWNNGFGVIPFTCGRINARHDVVTGFKIFLLRCEVCLSEQKIGARCKSLVVRIRVRKGVKPAFDHLLF